MFYRIRKIRKKLAGTHLARASWYTMRMSLQRKCYPAISSTIISRPSSVNSICTISKKHVIPIIASASITQILFVVKKICSLSLPKRKKSKNRQKQARCSGLTHTLSTSTRVASFHKVWQTLVCLN